MSVIIGAKTVEQLDDNLAAAELTLSPEEIAALDKASALKPEYPGWMLTRTAEDAFRRRRPERLAASAAAKGIDQGRDAMRKVKWGVLGVAKIAVEKVIPAMQQGEASHIAAIASRDLGKARAAADKLGIERAFGSYEELLADREIEAIYNPLPNELHVPWTLRALAAGKHVLCEKPIALDAEEARTLIEAREPLRQARRRGLHDPLPSAVAPREGTGRNRRRGRIARDPDLLLLSPARPRQCAQPAAGRRRRSTTSAATPSCRRDTFSAPSRRAWSRRSTATRTSRTDRSVGAILEFPGGRHSTFTLGTQKSAHQRVTIVGDAGRIEIMIPFNAPPDRPTEIAIDTGADLFGGGRRVEQFPVCDQYTLQGDAFSRAILGGTPLEFPIEDAILNMRVIDALFRSAKSGSWETP